mgnify:CR=1 FL=1
MANESINQSTADKNAELREYVQELRQDLELQNILAPEQRLPKATIEHLQKTYDEAKRELEEADGAFSPVA